MSILTDLTPEKAASFGAEAQSFNHGLQYRQMFDNAGLIEVLDRYPREKLGVFTMGLDPVDWRSWRRGTADGLSGEQLFEAVQNGRIWLNLRAVNRELPSYANLAREIFSELEGKVPGLKTFGHDVGLLLSSPGAHVFYHLDVLPVTLWQLRGRKTMWVYPTAAPYVSDEQLERIVLRETAEQFAYEPSWDEGAETYVMEPGMMVSWPQNAPHRLVNDQVMNVSLSIEHQTPAALMRANVIYANGLIRRRFGANPRLKDGFNPGNIAKFGFARAMKFAGAKPPAKPTVPPSFRLSDSQPGLLL
jgi:hypothetical protein